ncbi:MAG TPA: hypothetical protein PLY97_01205 [Acidocella sp.]|nr:hypothetical protein [Acidocella sp.]
MDKLAYPTDDPCAAPRHGAALASFHAMTAPAMASSALTAVVQ